MHLYILPTRIEETLHKTDYPYFTSPFAQSINLRLIEGRTERKKNHGLLCLSFCAVIFSVSGWLIQGSNRSKRGYERILWLLVFLRKTLPSFYTYSKFWIEWKAWPLVAVSTHPPAYSVAFVTHLPWTRFESYWSPCIVGPPKFCAYGALQTLLWIGQQGIVATRIKQISSVHMHGPLCHQTSFTEHKFKVYIIRNLDDDSRALNQVWGVSEPGVLCVTTGYKSVKIARVLGSQRAQF